MLNVARRLLPSFVLVAGTFWIVLANSSLIFTDVQPLANSSWRENDEELVVAIIEGLDEFISEPSNEEERGKALIASYDAWHKFWRQPEIDSWRMTRVDERSMQKSADELIAAHVRYRKEVKRRMDGKDSPGNEDLYKKIREIQLTNPLSDE